MWSAIIRLRREYSQQPDVAVTPVISGQPVPAAESNVANFTHLAATPQCFYNSWQVGFNDRDLKG